jgi:hypothetical protein
VAGSEQLRDDSRADPARCAGDKDSHDGWYLRLGILMSVTAITVDPTSVTVNA